MSDITYIGSTITPHQFGDGTCRPFTITSHTNTQIGDLMIFSTIVNTSTSDIDKQWIPPDSSWTMITNLRNYQGPSSSGFATSYWWKRSTVNGASSHTFTDIYDSAGSGCMSVYRGCAASRNPIDTNFSTYISPNNTNVKSGYYGLPVNISNLHTIICISCFRFNNSSFPNNANNNTLSPPFSAPLRVLKGITNEQYGVSMYSGIDYGYAIPWTTVNIASIPSLANNTFAFSLLPSSIESTRSYIISVT